MNEPNETQSTQAPIVLPELGGRVTEATVVRWKKKVGETVRAFGPILEIETDNLTMEIKAPRVGLLSKIIADRGTFVGVGAVIGMLGPTQTPLEDPIYRSGWIDEFPTLSKLSTWLGWKR